MALKQSPASYTVALLIFFLVASAPPALAQVPPVQLLTPGQLPLVDAIQIRGVLCYSPTGICIGGPGIGGVNFTMSCRTGTLGNGSGTLSVAQGVTNATGGFTITITTVAALADSLGTTTDAILNGDLPCNILVPVPVEAALCKSCPTLGSMTGTLTGAMALAGRTFTAGLGNVLNFRVSFGILTP